MKTCEKLSKKEIVNLTKNIPKFIYISDDSVKEKFKQVKSKGIYLPYLISSFGRVFSLHFNNTIDYNIKERKVSIDKYGYQTIRLKFNGKVYFSTIHRLVATAFIKNDAKKYKNQINHIDGIKTHNYVWNLEWCTPKENIYHCWKNGFHLRMSGGSNKKPTVMNEKDVISICEMLEKDVPIKIIHKLYRYKMSTIYNILTGHCWKYISDNYDFSKRSNPVKSNEYVHICI